MTYDEYREDVRVALDEYLDSPNATVEAAMALDRLVAAIEAE